MVLLLLALASVGGASVPKEPDRVVRARKQAQPAIAVMFDAAGVKYPPQELFLRVIKDEDVLEVWAAGKVGAPMVRITAFDICARSGAAGPKRHRGDGQVPEGFYRVDRWNAWSQFHLSLGIDYPNLSDRIRSGAADPGGDIFIHGGCATIGCVPIGDGPMEQLFLMATDARVRTIQVHIFPTRLSSELAATAAATSPWSAELQAGFHAFEQTRRPPRIRIDPRTGAYSVQPVRRATPSNVRPRRE